MKPQDKAIELYNKFCYAIGTERTDSGYYTNIIYAKQCTLIAIDECILTSKYMPETLNYWEQVKQEIQKL